MFNLINVRPYVGIMKHCLLASFAVFSSCNDVEKITDVIEEVTGYGLKIGNSALYLSQNQIIFDTPGLAPDFYDDRTFSVTNTTETELFFGPMTPSTADFTVLSTTCEEGTAFIEMLLAISLLDILHSPQGKNWYAANQLWGRPN